MALIIKKRVSLEFLGEEYKDAYVVFRSIPAIDLADIIGKTEGKEDSAVLIPIFIDTLQKYFLEGKAGEEDITKEDVGQFDANTVTTCFSILAGRDIDPKAEGTLKSTSSTEAPSA